MDFKKLSLAFFLIYLLTGLLIYSDFGINWDEGMLRDLGNTNWDYIFHSDKSLMSSQDRDHGPAMDILLIGMEKALRFTDSRSIYMARHLVIFCFSIFQLLSSSFQRAYYWVMTNGPF